MDPSPRPKLRFLHSADILNLVKLEAFRRLPTEAIKFALHPGKPGSLKARPDGTVLDGHHRLVVLLERAEIIDQLPRDTLEKDHEP
jgi:hypothetical protein